MKRGCRKEEEKEMRTKLREFEGWEESLLLPAGWMYKVHWEGFTNKKFSSNVSYLSREGKSFESIQTATEFMKLKGYYQSEITNCTEFLKFRNKTTIESRFSWDSSESVPPGWKVRSLESGSASRQYILSPWGLQYRSRVLAIQDMTKHGAATEDIEVMRAKLMEHEGWKKSELLPPKWIFKDTQEKRGVKICHITNKNIFARGLTSALRNIQKDSQSTPGDKENYMKFWKLHQGDCATEQHEWSVSRSVPKGWSVRMLKGSRSQEWIRSPQGEQYRTRLGALKHLINSENSSKSEINEMRQKAVEFEGWKMDSFLPKLWMSKMTWTGISMKGNKKPKKLPKPQYKYFSKEGFTFRNVTEVVEHLAASALYSDNDIKKCQAGIQEEHDAKVNKVSPIEITPMSEKREVG